MNRALDAYAMRQSTIAKNVANATTPGYSPEMVKFEEFFAEQKSTARGVLTNEVHIPIGAKPDGLILPEDLDAEVPAPERYFSGESHVNIDKEMAELAENQIRFRFASRATSKYFDGMSTAIRGIR